MMSFETEPSTTVAHAFLPMMVAAWSMMLRLETLS